MFAKTLLQKKGFITPHTFDRYLCQLNELATEHKYYTQLEGFVFDSVEKVESGQPKYYYNIKEPSSYEDQQKADTLAKDTITIFEKWYKENHDP